MQPERVPPVVGVLLVEDSDGDARLIQEFLKEETASGADFRVTRVTHLAGALEELERSRFDVVLLDLWLPDSAGVQTVIRVRLRCSDTPMVVLTGNTDQRIGVQALNAGAQDFFVKGRIDSSLLAKALLRQVKQATVRNLGRLAAPVSVRVLIVEDNAGDARLLQLALAGQPIRGVTFNSTQVARLSEALDCLAQIQFDVILLDLWLPDSGGVETVTRIRPASGDTPVIVITGDTDEHVGSEALRAGAQDFLVKANLDAQLLTARLLRQVKHEGAA